MTQTQISLTLWPEDWTVPAHWLRAAMPGAPLHVLDDGVLVCCEDGSGVAMSAALTATMACIGESGDTVVALCGNAPWRLRRCGRGAASIWWAQLIEDSRARLLAEWRAHLATRLSAQLLHDLRNPMNALSLHTDLMVRLIANPETAPRAGSSLQVIRERLNDLSARQNGFVSLWLAPINDEPRADNLQQLIEKVLRMMRSHYALHEVRGRTLGLEKLAAAPAVRVDARMELVIIGLLLLACDTLVAQTDGAAGMEIVIEACAPADGDAMPSLWLRAPMPRAMTVSGRHRHQRVATVADVVDEFALLLDDAGIRLQRVDEDRALRLDFDTT